MQLSESSNSQPLSEKADKYWYSVSISVHICFRSGLRSGPGNSDPHTAEGKASVCELEQEKGLSQSDRTKFIDLLGVCGQERVTAPLVICVLQVAC